MPKLFPSYPELLRSWRRIAPDRVAVVDRTRDVRVTYAALDGATDDWLRVLRGRGVRTGDRIAALTGTRHETVALFFACGRMGAALVPLNWRLAVPELAAVLFDAQPALLVYDAMFSQSARALLGRSAFASLPTLHIDEDYAVELANADAQPVHDVSVDGETPWLVLYTSGSTGKPKGAVLPHRQMLYNAVATTTAWELGPQDVVPVATPLFHTGGWNVLATPIWMRGGTAVLFDRFEPGEYLAGLAEEGCTIAFGVPTQLLMLLEHPEWRHIASVRRFVTGGAPCPQAIADRIRATGYGFRQGYGLTECGPNCFTISDEEALRRAGSVGWPMPFLETRLVDEGGGDVLDGQTGELLLRGPQLFSGYLRDPARTTDALTPDGWLRTGDLAVRDADGAYRIAGRRKEMYISGGENVFPGEVEAVLVECPGVQEVVVVGIPHAHWGEVGCAFVVPRADGIATEAIVTGFARERLAGYKVPRRVVMLGELPRLGSGKPDRHRLVQLATQPMQVMT